MKTITMLLCLTLAFCSQSFSQQFYAGTSLTSNGLQLNGGFIIEDNYFIQSDLSHKPGGSQFLNQLTLLGGRQFVIYDEMNDREVFLKLAPSFGVALNNYTELVKAGSYIEKYNRDFAYDTYKNSSSTNMIYKLELALHREPFEYFIVVGYSKTSFVGIGWRGIFKNKNR